MDVSESAHERSSVVQKVPITTAFAAQNVSLGEPRGSRGEDESSDGICALVRTTSVI